jgi:hypothetical protein
MVANIYYLRLPLVYQVVCTMCPLNGIVATLLCPTPVRSVMNVTMATCLHESALLCGVRIDQLVFLPLRHLPHAAVLEAGPLIE